MGEYVMIILASQSPRRKELFSLITADFKIIPAVGEERADRSLPPSEYVVELAKHKALEVAEKYPEEVVIGADTVVVINGEILGKPKDEADAKRMLRLLSGTEHSVYTGMCLSCGNMNRNFCEETKVRFFTLSDREIEEYTASGEPFDKAGAYGIQGTGALLVSGITGDYYNVMGLPVGRLYREMRESCLLK
ncbi:MAG: septum formation inhibitor Maf [Ruminiclostridium sp.]|nr:septum formation inhibitor Maf [Ruminiclostridium sp.]